MTRFRPLILCALISGPSFLSVTPANAETASAVSRYQLSRQMYELGTAERDPVLMIAAAKTRKSVSPEPGTLAPDGASSEAADAELLTWQDMLAEAQAASGDDAILLALIADVEAEASKGVMNGPVYNIAKIAGSKTDLYSKVPFAGGVYAEVYIEGKGTSDLNLHIYDHQDRLVCSDTDSSDIAYCGWKPAAAGSFSIKITNRGDTANQYSLMTN